ncbi:unnamed protein product [Ceratitis capitata]|uniref:(Mediterranean fruit fly) hypothetical protein n=1 Tax=Ceratitis capitata TaxID=7213 RepID=A0A811UM18_CERCA|nr:unnamed protein product [Ceratitis capitata]
MGACLGLKYCRMYLQQHQRNTCRQQCEVFSKRQRQLRGGNVTGGNNKYEQSVTQHQRQRHATLTQSQHCFVCQLLVVCAVNGQLSCTVEYYCKCCQYGRGHYAQIRMESAIQGNMIELFESKLENFMNIQLRLLQEDTGDFLPFYVWEDSVTLLQFFLLLALLLISFWGKKLRTDIDFSPSLSTKQQQQLRNVTCCKQRAQISGRSKWSIELDFK